MNAIKELYQFFGEDVPFTIHIYDTNTGSMSIGDGTTLILKENVPDIKEDEIFIIDRTKREPLVINSSQLSVVIKKETLLVLKYGNSLLFCMAEAADLFKSLIRRQEHYLYQQSLNAVTN